MVLWKGEWKGDWKGERIIGDEMRTIDTIVEIGDDGTILVKAPKDIPTGRRRVRIVIGEEIGKTSEKKEFPDLATFRESLGCAPYDGNSVVDLREEERA